MVRKYLSAGSLVVQWRAAVVTLALCAGAALLGPSAAMGAPMTPHYTGTARLGPYRVVMTIGPNEKMYTLAQYHALHPKSGEVILRGVMPSMSGMHAGGMFVPHHLEVHIYNASSGAVVTTAAVAIAVTDMHTHMITHVTPLLMRGVLAGPQDTHYGNMVMLMTEHYRVDVTANGRHAAFIVYWKEPASGGMPSM